MRPEINTLLDSEAQRSPGGPQVQRVSNHKFKYGSKFGICR